MSELLIKPKEITKDSDTGIEIASFGYYDGIKVAQSRDLNQTVLFTQVNKSTHFIVCCGDVMFKVESDEYPDMIRRVI